MDTELVANKCSRDNEPTNRTSAMRIGAPFTVPPLTLSQIPELVSWSSGGA
jgi:hypothetical protein